MKKVLSALLTLILIMCCIFPTASYSVSADSQFTFNGSMSKEVLRSYLSRAVTHSDLVLEQYNKLNPLFDEDMRMLRRIGAKFIGRATTFSWNCDFNKQSQIDTHFTMVKEQVAKAHKLDPEMIFQAGIFEIAYETAVNCQPIPSYVFEAFGQPVTTRNFNFTKIVFPAGTKDKNGTDTGIGCWGMKQVCGVPDITQLETKMYFYYLITRYIDAGFEAIHMGQAEKMMLYRGNSYASHWEELLTKARSYAKTHARRGIVLFDCHTAIDSGGIKVGNRLVFDFQGAGLCPNETVNKDGALQCKLEDYNECWLSWLGRTAGGTHPLGFTVDNNFTLLEFDNYNGNGKPGVATPEAFYNWGFDDITWFAMQPEWYRNQFLKETAQYLCSNWLDSNNGQQYFLQMPCHRKVTPYASYGYPKVEYTPGENYSSDFVNDYAKDTSSILEYNGDTNKYTISSKSRYKANRNSDACPGGFNQEDTIREIFLGKNAPEDPELLKVTLPDGYSTEQSYVKEFTVRTRQSDVILSSDKVISNIAKVNQGTMIDIWAGYRPAGEAADLSHLQLLNDQSLVLQLELDKNATSLRLQNLDFDSAQKFKIEISDDNHAYYTLVDYTGGIDNNNLESIIKPQYLDNEGASAYVLNKATINSGGKKVVYLKITAHQNGGQIRIKSFDVATTRNKNLKFKNIERQQFIAKTVCRSDYQPDTSSPYYFNKYLVSDKSNYVGLYHMIKLDSTYTHVVFKFDLENTATSFNPYLYVAGDKTAKIKIEASKNGTSWVEIIPATVVEPNKYYGDIGTTAWKNINLTNVNTVLTSNSSKTVYLRFTYAGADKHSELQLQHFGISAEFEIDPVALGHTPGAAATCTTAQTCTGCKAVLQAALGHNYKATVTAPTCTAQGYTTHKCTRCSSSYKDTYTNAKGHKSTNGGTSGVHTKCSVCGTTISSTHSYGSITYTWTNYTACKGSRSCSCGYTQTVSATITNEVTKAATCTATGTKKYTAKFSNSAFATQTKTETLAKNASNHSGSSINGGTRGVHTKYSCCGVTISTTHSYTKTTQTAATCTAKGTSKYTCSCGYSYTSQDIAAKGHTEVTDKAVAATCTTAGKTEGKHCSVCNAVTVAQQTVSALGHKPKTAVTENNVKPTCTANGSYDTVVYCAVCGDEISREKSTVSALGHSYSSSVTDPTCETKGYTTYTCSVCGDTYKAEEVAALGHTAGNVVMESNFTPDNENYRFYDNVVYCEKCGQELSRETISIELGDCNLDGEVDVLDLIAMKKSVLDDEDYSAHRDFNEDDAINSLDVIAVKKYLFENF